MEGARYSSSSSSKLRDLRLAAERGRGEEVVVVDLRLEALDLLGVEGVEGVEVVMLVAMEVPVVGSWCCEVEVLELGVVAASSSGCSGAWSASWLAEGAEVVEVT